MSKRFIQSLIITLLTFCFSESVLFAQGMSRSTGLGFRLGFWNVTNHPTRISSVGYGQDATVDIGGAGAWIYFFSRVHQNWFLEFNLGAVAGVHQEHSGYVVKNVEATAIIPFLFGARYDIFSPRLPSSIQPYLSFGTGPYWIASVKNENLLTASVQTVESNLQYGAYAGGGANILLASWFALNFDLKYHFVDFQFEKNYSGLEFGMGFSLIWGKKREVIQVKDIRLIVKDIYPVYYQFYNIYPLALVSIKNVANYPIEVNVRSHIRPFSERPKDSGFVRIEKGKTKDVPVTAIFGKRLLQVNQREPAVLDIEIEARAGATLKKQLSAQVIVHTRNSWNGEMDKLSLFITSDDEEILRLSREFVNEKQANYNTEAINFEKAKIIFNKLRQKGIHYRSDPNILFYQDDRVQYALETIDQRGGDCDDLVVLYASLLESIGIKTAFVEVRDPQKDIAHLYLIFDSGLQPNQGQLISSNEKRFIIRDKANNQKAIWIPVETTLIDQGFEQAWKTGATEFLQEGIVRNGIEEGWVRIIDVE